MKVSKKQNLQKFKTFSLTTPQTTKVQGGDGGGMIELMPDINKKQPTRP